MASLCPDDIGIILTYRCASNCKHCIYNCGSKWPKDAMSPEMLREALEVLGTWEQCPQVHFTGGEPFLYFDLLLEGTRIATELGITAYLETSGAWCTDENQTRKKFQALKEAGLKAVLVSCSPFHAEHVPPVRTLRAASTAIAIFGLHRVTIYQAQFLAMMKRFGIDHPTPLSRYEETFGTAETYHLLWEGFGIIPGGRSGYALDHLTPKHPAETFAHDNCAGTLLYAPHSHFDLYGNYIPGFCGGLTLGDWRRLSQIKMDFQVGHFSPLLKVLIDQGPYGLMKMAREKYGYISTESGYVGKCHLCVDVRRHIAKRGAFEGLRPQEFYTNF
jgi:hypothetical protein